MLIYAVFVFAAAALIGLLLASSVLRGKFAPWGLSLLHAALGATGLVMLLLTVFDGEGGLVLIGFIIVLKKAECQTRNQQESGNRRTGMNDDDAARRDLLV